MIVVSTLADAATGSAAPYAGQPSAGVSLTPAHPKGKAPDEARSRAGGVPAGDEIITATSDTAGYHLFAAAAGDHWSWHALATLQPGGYSDAAWIGEECLTGDGRYVVAVVAPWDAQNSAAGIAAGGFAYAVNAHTGAVRPLASGLLLAYFNPGCGPGSTVALSRYLSPGQSSTQILIVDAATGAMTSTPTIPDQVTSAVPAADGAVYAAEGHRFVRIAPDGSVRVILRNNGQVFDLTPNALGGVDYLAEDAAGRASSAIGVYRLAGGKVSQLTSGALSGLRLLPGRGGHDMILGAAGNRSAAIRAVGTASEDAAETGSIAAISSEGTVAVQPSGSAHVVRLVSLAGTASGGGQLPAPAAAVKARPPVPRIARTAALPAMPPNGGGDTGATCAIPRNDPAYQVPQPSAEQIRWALSLAAQGALPPRSSSYANLNTGSYDPSGDFPLPSPFSATNGIPQQILDGIFAQESNWNQASPHAPAGLAGNPLIADYYGIYSQLNPTGYINFPLADCGYGLGQITDGMRLPALGDQPTAVQKRIALDYAENAAATAQILATKWNYLSGNDITVGDNNPEDIENWYFVIWAYNSGVNPQPSTGGTGCTPGPDCTDSALNWGLGWTNNPANPTYDPQRHPFLHYVDGNGVPHLSYNDAATPQNWPYQEKVFGWIESGQYEGDGVTLKYTPTYDYSSNAGYFLHLPGVYDFCNNTDNCTAANAAQPCGYSGGGPLQWHCWWHEPAPVNFCGGACHGGSWSYSGVDSEPTAANPFPSVCDQSGLPYGLAAPLIVDDNTAETNLAGCRTPAADAAMTWTPDIDPNGGPFGDVDLHQLGTGYGGRTMFTHLEDPANAPLWGGTMAWAPKGIDPQYKYEIDIFVPSLGAAGTLTYNVVNGGRVVASVPVDQNNYSNQWVNIGSYALFPGDSVNTTNIVSGGDGTTDVAFDAIAFTPIASWTESDAAGNLLNLISSAANGPSATGGPILRLTDNLGHTMDTAKIIRGGPNSYLAVYTAGSTVDLASSIDLIHWTFVTNLDPVASQPYLFEEANGSFLLADERWDNAGDSGSSHVAILHYPNLPALESEQPDWLREPPLNQLLSGDRFFSHCNEGTPNIYNTSLDGSTIYFRFHWLADCGSGLDREAYGTLSVPGPWTVSEDTTRDMAVTNAGYPGKHGERDDITWHGWQFSLQEVQQDSNLGGYANWRFVLYDYADHQVFAAPVTSSVKSACHGNPRITLLTDPGGALDLLITGYIFGPNSADNGCVASGEESGPFAYTVPVT